MGNVNDSAEGGPFGGARGLLGQVPDGCGRGGDDAAVLDENPGPSCAGEGGDDVEVIGAVDVAHFVCAISAVPFGEGDVV